MLQKNEAYTAISAMLRAREARLLSREDAEKLLMAGSPDNAAKALAERGWEDLSGLGGAALEAAFGRHRLALFREMERLLPDRELLDLFRFRYDCHNAKVMVKAEALGQAPDALLSEAGSVPPERLKEAFREERYSLLPGWLSGALKEAREQLARGSGPEAADSLLDRACFEALSGLAKSAGNAFVSGYVEALIDAANLKIALRARRMGRSQERILALLLSGGGIPAAEIAAASDKDAFAALGAGGIFREAAELAGEALDGATVTATEKALDNALTRYLKDAKLKGFGPEPVLGYLAAAEQEITAVRMLMTALSRGLDPKMTAERLRDAYA